MLVSKFNSDKKVLIILHGLFGNSDNWQNLAKRFATNFSVFSLDLRNHGESSHMPTMSYPEMATDLCTFMNTHGIQKAAVIGHSMGGKVAMQFANDFGERVQQLIVADIAPKGYEPHFQSFINAMLEVNFANVNSRKDVDSQLQAAVPELSVRQFLLKNVKRDSSGQFSWRLNLPAIAENYAELINSISITNVINTETLFIRGGKSNYISDADIPQLEMQFSSCHVETIEGAGHWLHAEKPDEFYSFVMSFLQE